MTVKTLSLIFVLGRLLHGQPMGVCEVLANLSAFTGKQIEVRGVWRKGDTGESLWAAPHCEKPAIRDHWEFTDAIRVEPLKGSQSASGYYQDYHRLAKDHPGSNIVVTLDGILEAPEHFEVWTDPWGIRRPLAFRSGASQELARFAARLTYSRAVDFKPVRPPFETQEEIERRAHSWPRPAR